MKNLITTLALAACLLTLLPAAAQAKGWYLGAAGGVSLDSDISMSPQVTLEFDNGGAYALNGGYDFGWFRLDLEGGRQKNEVGSVLLSGLPMGGTGDVTLNKIMFNTCFEFDIANLVTPWLGLGIGVADIAFNRVQTPTLGMLIDDANTGSISQMQLGTAVRFSDHLLGTVTYERIKVTMEFTGPYYWQVSRDDFVSQTVLFGLRYQF